MIQLPESRKSVFKDFFLNYFSKTFFVSTLFLQTKMGKLTNPLSTNPTKWSNTLKQFVDNLPTNCLSVFDHFVTSALEGLSLVFDKIWNSYCHLFALTDVAWCIRLSYIQFHVIFIRLIMPCFHCAPEPNKKDICKWINLMKLIVIVVVVAAAVVVVGIRRFSLHFFLLSVFS